MSDRELMGLVWGVSLLLFLLPAVLRLSGGQRHLLQRAAIVVLAFGFLVALYRTAEWLLAG
ncbi:MAG TPA: hypothetical protein VFG47_20820 [Geminicoccaceae bacterium]|nr:hypothetical protein [Geminicoccaceae bacterium]